MVAPTLKTGIMKFNSLIFYLREYLCIKYGYTLSQNPPPTRRGDHWSSASRFTVKGYWNALLSETSTILLGLERTVEDAGPYNNKGWLFMRWKIHRFVRATDGRPYIENGENDVQIHHQPVGVGRLCGEIYSMGFVFFGRKF